MISDRIRSLFLERVARDARQAVADSDVLRLVAGPGDGDAPDTYHGMLSGIEHFERAPNGTPLTSDGPIPFDLHFPHDYLKSLDPQLQFRVVSVGIPFFHPNHRGGGDRGGVICLGPRFRPGTPLRPLLEQVHGILSARVFATRDSLDPDARKFFLAHLDRVRSLKAEPLWRAAKSGVANEGPRRGGGIHGAR